MAKQRPRRMFKVGESVTFIDSHGNKHRGTIKYDEGERYDMSNKQSYAILEGNGFSHDYVPISRISSVRDTRPLVAAAPVFDARRPVVGAAEPGTSQLILPRYGMGKSSRDPREALRDYVIASEPHTRGHHRGDCDADCRAGRRGHPHWIHSPQGRT